jgi:hypothetical protein
MTVRRFASVVLNPLKFLERWFARWFVRRFPAVPRKPLKSLVRRFRGGCGAIPPIPPYALRGAIGARHGRMAAGRCHPSATTNPLTRVAFAAPSGLEKAMGDNPQPEAAHRRLAPRIGDG